MTVAIRARFPKLAAAMGDEVFHTMLGSFMAHQRHAHHSLIVTNTELPEYLAAMSDYPVWYSELAALDRAHATVTHAPNVAKLARCDLTNERELRLVPAHAVLQLTTTADELWTRLDDAAANCTRARASRPRSLDWPRTVLLWRLEEMDVRDRLVDFDEAAALRAAVRGTSIVALAAGLGGPNPHARAVDLALQWIDSGMLRAAR